MNYYEYERRGMSVYVTRENEESYSLGWGTWCFDLQKRFKPETHSDVLIGAVIKAIWFDGYRVRIDERGLAWAHDGSEWKFVFDDMLLNCHGYHCVCVKYGKEEVAIDVRKVMASSSDMRGFWDIMREIGEIVFEIEKIDFSTIDDVERMRELCAKMDQFYYIFKFEVRDTNTGIPVYYTDRREKADDVAEKYGELFEVICNY